VFGGVFFQVGGKQRGWRWVAIGWQAEDQHADGRITREKVVGGLGARKIMSGKGGNRESRSDRLIGERRNGTARGDASAKGR
jgi:hypothetical protein